MILLDTNTLIQYFRGLEPVVRRFLLTPRREMRIPSIVAYEVEYGAWKTGSVSRRKATENVLTVIPQVPFDVAAASETARIRIDLERRGLVIGPLDLMIAGSAVSRDAVLVTNNTPEFSRIKGLRLQDWTK
jgi:tRNA(fMet)-specific endonuclease VapC